MPKNEAKSKSVRKPLRDVSNKNKNGGRFSKPLDSKKRFSEKEKEQVGDRCCNVEEDDSLDTLLLVQSDLSSLIHQVSINTLLTICLVLGILY
jgi:hypothetical protein